MVQELWIRIAELFIEMETGIDTFVKSDTPETADIIGDPDNNLLVVRENMRKQLDQLRINMADRLTEQESYFVLFALVIYLDEYIQLNVLKKADLSWPLLQRELFEIDDGGNLFYETLDHMLKKPELSLFIFEVYYFCLKHGFVGRYIDDTVTISEYVKTLENKIKTEKIEAQIGIPDDIRPLPRLFSPLWYYGACAGLLFCCYFVFSRFA